MRYGASFVILFSLLRYSSPGSGQSPTEHSVHFADLFDFGPRLTLEENPEVVNAAPYISFDRNDGLLVWDGMEQQVRIYARDGKLRHHFGRRGQGPGEFRRLAGAERLLSGNIVTADANGRLTIWDSIGSHVLRDVSLNLFRITSISVLGNDSLAVTTVPSVTDPQNLAVPILHIVDLASGQVVTDGLAPPMTLSTVGAWTTVNVGGSLRTTRALYVTLPIVDTLYASEGDRDNFRRIAISNEITRKNGPTPNAHAERRRFEDWLRSVTFIGDVFGDEVHGFAIQLFGAGQTANRGIIYVAAGFTDIYAVPDAPAVLAFDSRTGNFLFKDPDWLEPNRLRFAKVRRR